MRKILPRILGSIKPAHGELEQEIDFANFLVSHIQKNAPAQCKVVLTGSIAKHTFLRDKKDVDIFVLFDQSFPRMELESAIKGVMGAAFPTIGYQLSYAEHPYVRFHFQGRRIDLVPAYKITKASERISAVDRSVLHTRFIISSLTEKQLDSVLLFKQFLRANNLYGAEIKIGGFSGYLCELLVIKYRNFQLLVRAAAKWKMTRGKSTVFLDLKKYYKGKKEIENATKHCGSPLVFIDPVDKNRNVAAAISKENILRFISLCKKFVKNPSEKFFFVKPETFEDQIATLAKSKRKNDRAVYTLSMPRPDIVDDVLWGQLYKMIHQLKAHLKEFEPGEIIADDSKHLVRLGIALKRDRLSEKMLVAGPPLEMKKHIIQFKKSHKKGRFITKKKKIYAEVKRPKADIMAETVIRAFFKSFANTKSHLAYPEEMIILEKF